MGRVAPQLIGCGSGQVMPHLMGGAVRPGLTPFTLKERKKKREKPVTCIDYFISLYSLSLSPLCPPLSSAIVLRGRGSTDGVI